MIKTGRLLLTAVLAFALAGVAFAALQGVAALAQGDSGPGLVVFASDRSGNYEIYALDPQTGLTTQLTNDPGNDVEPQWSPEGEQIVFASDRDGDYELYVMNADGTDLVKLTNNMAEDRQPRWQPDGLNIVYVSDVNGQWDLYLISANGATVRQLTNDAADERGPGTVAEGPAAPGTVAPGPAATQAIVVTATPSLPDGVVNAATLNVRANPGEGASILTKVNRDTPLKILGRYFDNSWIQVQLPNGVVGWVYRPLVTLNIDLSTVPVLNVQFIAPPPTATPTLAATAAPQVIIEFWADKTTIAPGQCAVLSWRVEGIREVYFQGTGVVGWGSTQVCPGATTTYNLRVIRVDGVEDNRYITIVVG
ncbi:MAG: SH3 domain-containing protein [Anaerolineae bacterium]|nr:SH3 domain-containing protein [Anaerolineae bacterium]